MSKKISLYMLAFSLAMSSTGVLAMPVGNIQEGIGNDFLAEGIYQGDTTDKVQVEENTQVGTELEGEAILENEQETEETPELEDQGQVEEDLESEEDLSVPGLENADSNKAILIIDNNQALVYGELMTLTMPPKIIGGRTYLPLRFMGEEILEAQVDYNQTTKEITIKKDAINVVLVPGSATALVNNVVVPLDAPVIIENGATLLPLRFMVEQFDLDIVYTKETQTIEIEKKEVIPNIPPQVTFEFDEANYTVGETLTATVETSDEEGHAIVAYKWMLDEKSNQVYPTLAQLSKHVKPNLSPISLQVQDEMGAWSEWYTVYVVIKPNSPPVVKDFASTEKTYDQGEPITFDYEYINEEWEEIKAEKWTYRSTKDMPNNSLFKKPEAIYAEGEYIVTLELQDEAGNWSTKAETIVTVTDKVLKTEFEHIFSKGQIGDTITNFEGTNYRDYKDVDYVSERDVAGTLVFSDSPEVVREEGILYEETVTGTGRVLFHHINAINSLEKKKLVVVAENRTELAAGGIISNKVVKGPSTDVLFVGQQLLHDYFASNHAEQLMLNPGEKKVIYDSSSKNWFKDQAISGMFNFDFVGDVTFTFAVMGVNDSIDTLGNLKILERDVHPRGTFDVINRDVEVDLTEQEGPSKIVIGSGADEWLVGTDGITGEMTMNKGNFGVEYHIAITAEEDTAVIINPRGNMYKGAIKWQDDKSYMTPVSGYFPSSNRATFAGVVRAGQTRTLTYMLPNGSSAPVLLGFVPRSDWK